MPALTRRRVLAAGAAIVVAAVIAIGLTEAPNDHTQIVTSPTPAQARAALAGSPAPLAALHARADDVLTGGLTAIRRELTNLHGFPVVINAWAAWCAPCRAESALFSRAAVNYGRKVAFVGVDGDSSTAAASGWLRTHPVSYPSYFDPSNTIEGAILRTEDHPTTMFLSANGSFYIHPGAYLSLEDLEHDIRTYALG